MRIQRQVRDDGAYGVVEFIVESDDLADDVGLAEVPDGRSSGDQQA